MSTPSVFPSISASDVLAFQFSSWYPIFKRLSIKSTIIQPLGDDFKRYLLSDGVQIPLGSDDSVERLENIEDDDGSAFGNDDADTEEPEERFAFPELDAQIRQVIAEYDAVFPKLNFSSPKDAAWILPSSSPLKCTSPMDVYVLLKSSDFITHDLSPEHVFEGCEHVPPPLLPSTASEPEKHPPSIDETETVVVAPKTWQNQEQDKGQLGRPPYDLELVLRKWYHVDPAREFRCFVRDRQLLAISQRDENYYDFMNEEEAREKIKDTIAGYWDREIKERWSFTKDYVFDLLLTRNLESAHIVDFNPYAPRTDSLLFTYEELAELHEEQRSQPRSSEPSSPVLRTVDSQLHPAAARNAPANVHNRVPFEMYAMSSGLTVEEFANTWKAEIQKAMEDDSE